MTPAQADAANGALVHAVRKARWGYTAFTSSCRGFDAGVLQANVQEGGPVGYTWDVGTRDFPYRLTGTATSERAAMKAARAAALGLAGDFYGWSGGGF